MPTEDTCPDNRVFCDAKRDCQLGSDETNCGEEETQSEINRSVAMEIKKFIQDGPLVHDSSALPNIHSVHCFGKKNN